MLIADERRKSLGPEGRRWHDRRPTKRDRLCEAVVALSLLLLGLACLLQAAR